MTAKIEVTDHPINYRPGPNGLNSTWGLTINGKRVGTVWETEDDKYAGRIEGQTTDGRHREYTCPGVAFRETVIDQLAKMAERIGIAF